MFKHTRNTDNSGIRFYKQTYNEQEALWATNLTWALGSSIQGNKSKAAQ